MNHKESYEKFLRMFVHEHIRVYDLEQLVDSLVRVIENQQSHLNAYYSRHEPEDSAIAKEREGLKRMVRNVLKKI